MPRKNLFVYGILAVVDVLLGVATNLLADMIGKTGASVVGGTMFLAVIVTFGKLRGDETRRRTSVAVTLVAALLLFAVATSNAPQETGNDTPLPPKSPSPSQSPTPVPTQRSLSQYLAAWQNGPIKISVERYNTWVTRADSADDVDATIFDLRVGIRNESTAGIYLDTAPGSLVLLMDKSFPSGTYSEDQQRISEVPTGWHLYAVGFDNDDDYVTVDGRKHAIDWTGGRLEVGDRFSATSPAHNGAGYVVPPPAAKSASEIDAVPPQSAHVIGVAWLGTDGTVQGYTPVEKWSGPNTMDSFLHA